jgi:hypothetical protein
MNLGSCKLIKLIPTECVYETINANDVNVAEPIQKPLPIAAVVLPT